ncbi:MAG: hypothetical protein M3N57_02775 [Actinomycetota bacterium]|nr:hypothetical protein [Actinomycetota bacterium]
MLSLIQILLQDAPSGPPLGGWYVGLAIGFVIVLVVVVVVASILNSAQTINQQARVAIDALDDGYRNTLGMWDVATVDEHAMHILHSAQSVRQVLGG